MPETIHLEWKCHQLCDVPSHIYSIRFTILLFLSATSTHQGGGKQQHCVRAAFNCNDGGRRLTLGVRTSSLTAARGAQASAMTDPGVLVVPHIIIASLTPVTCVLTCGENRSRSLIDRHTHVLQWKVVAWGSGSVPPGAVFCCCPYFINHKFLPQSRYFSGFFLETLRVRKPNLKACDYSNLAPLPLPGSPFYLNFLQRAVFIFTLLFLDLLVSFHSSFWALCCHKFCTV